MDESNPARLTLQELEVVNAMGAAYRAFVSDWRLVLPADRSASK